jgi:hypothetical protein
MVGQEAGHIVAGRDGDTEKDANGRNTTMPRAIPAGKAAWEPAPCTASHFPSEIAT